MKNIFNLFIENKEKLPFAAKQNHWQETKYVIFYRISKDKNIAYGFLFENGKRNLIYSNSISLKVKGEIDDAHIPKWELVTNLDMSGFERDTIFNLNSIITSGKYFGLSIEEICLNDSGYIEWAILNCNYIPYFCVSEEVISFISNKRISIPKEIIEYNFKKVNYVMSNFNDDFNPENK